MKTDNEIAEYLNISDRKYIDIAKEIEVEYEEEIAKQIVGYGLACDYYSNPTLLEDEHIEQIENRDGIVIYKRCI